MSISRRQFLGSATMLLAPGCTARAAPLPVLDITLPAGAPLQPMGGLVLDDAALGFGGLSGLHLAPDLTITAISDLGRWMSGRLVLRPGPMRQDRLAGLSGLRAGRLQDGAGQPLRRGFTGDAESLARLPDGTWLVGFERWHRIRAYAHLDGPGRYVEAPPGLEAAPANGGLEALTILPDGRWLAIAESLSPPGQPDLRQGWIGGPGRWAGLTYRPQPGMVPVDAAALPDGGALVLERRFSLFGGFTARLLRLPAASLAPDAVLAGEAVLDLSGPVPAENWEGVAVARADGRTLVALCSDDNENPLQRSLILLFALADD